MKLEIVMTDKEFEHAAKASGWGDVEWREDGTPRDWPAEHVEGWLWKLAADAPLPGTKDPACGAWSAGSAAGRGYTWRCIDDPVGSFPEAAREAETPPAPRWGCPKCEWGKPGDGPQCVDPRGRSACEADARRAAAANFSTREIQIQELRAALRLQGAGTQKELPDDERARVAIEKITQAAKDDLQAEARELQASLRLATERRERAEQNLEEAASQHNGSREPAPWERPRAVEPPRARCYLGSQITAIHDVPASTWQWWRENGLVTWPDRSG